MAVYSNYDTSVFSFVNPLHNNEKYLMNIPEMFKGYKICFSKGGWLLMSDGLRFFFYNPFTRSSIELLIPFSSSSGISFSSLPTSSDCNIFVFDKPLGREVSISFINLREEDWLGSHGSFDGSYLASNKKLVEFDTNLNNPTFYNGAFYCLDRNGILGVSKQENGIISWEVLAMVPRPNCEFIYESYLVECEGKLLCVLLGHLGKWVRIFRLNNTRMVWAEVENLGQHMLCISNTSCISAVAPTSKMENKIYFSRLHEEGILLYSLDTGMYHCLGSRHSSKDYRDTKEVLWCSWIEPNWSESSDQFPDWLRI
ncbi:F-box/kelch-repeat protein At1g57790-like isoform X1 [Papaver somniferum]|uniref:F-box/kelch-repeat protein At1g57790-like isoform X1 n=1 Tax=Papaver somniferum TaxID=3469 RepID=UPI000E6FE999|nr:F-box/kelch-repeat protein At1g57790-like isoform X1 [Papaver somniferum]XP_026406555.1 F-box/kelch-repeat protein At1g57790-like isoform X1 [Papaver somniferum]XP_026406556.1 F-box/kelch-repeat protein At1g57790-like isoform X1 [Papaver somniferum]